MLRPGERRKASRAIKGELPSPVNPPSGCRFRTRCQFAQERCAAEEPELRSFGPGHVALAERVFTRYGVWAVFFGRFIALLRILAGPLAGSLRLPYFRFLAANVCGGIVWATGITYLIWYLGVAAEKWMSRASWIALVVAVLVGLLITLLIRRKTGTLVRQAEAEARAEAEAEAEADLSAVSGAITPETADKEG